MSNQTRDECSGVALAVGSVRGIRTFDVDALGRLTAVTRTSVWRPGENVATCPLPTKEKYEELQAKISPPKLEDGYEITYSFNVGSSFLYGFSGQEYCRGIAHPVCSCGFYAYHDGSIYPTGQVTGVIEGYGKTTVGTKGFRCEKARIVALAVPRQQRKPRTLERLAAGLTVWCFGWIPWHAYRIATDPSDWARYALLVVMLGLGIYNAWQWRRTRRKRLAVLPANGQDLRAVIERNYPDVQVFDSVAAMRKALPPDRGEQPTPETDPEFWERAS